MDTIQINVPSTIAVTLKYLGDVELALEGKTPDWFAWAIANGVRQSVADADAGKANTPEGEKAVTAKWEKISSGEIPAGGGGGGARLSTEDEAALRWFRNKEPKRKFVGSKLETYWADVTRQTLIKAMVARGDTEEAIKNADWGKLLEENQATVRAWCYANDAKLQGFVLAVTSEREAKKEQPAVLKAVEGLTF